MKSMFFKTMTLGAAMAAFLVFPANSGAAIITGNFDGFGSLTLTNGLVTFTNSGVAGGGIFTVQTATPGSVFAPLVGTTATLKPLNQTLQPAGNPAPAGFVQIPNFLSFTANPALNITLTGVDPAILPPTNCLTPAAAAAAGDLCGTGPFNLINTTRTSSSDSFSIRGKISDGSASPASTLGGVFTAQFADKNFETVRDTITSGGSVTTTYSASFTTTPSSVPEPATMSFMGLGLLALAAGVRRRARQ